MANRLNGGSIDQDPEDAGEKERPTGFDAVKIDFERSVNEFFGNVTESFSSLFEFKKEDEALYVDELKEDERSAETNDALAEVLKHMNGAGKK